MPEKGLDWRKPPLSHEDWSTEIESLPEYQCTVDMASLYLLKWELDKPSLAAKRRRWHRAEIHVIGTQLQIYIDATNRILSLQGADAGVATDYRRRSFVLRIRAEGRQFLIAAGTQAAMMELLIKLNESIAISLPLDAREDPPTHTLPRKRRPSNPISLSDEFRRCWREHGWTNKQDKRWLEWRRSSGMPKVAEIRSSEKTTGMEPTEKEAWARDVPTSAPESKDHKPGLHFGSLSEEDLTQAQRCARILTYSSAWRDRWYFRDGLAIDNPMWREAPPRGARMNSVASLEVSPATAWAALI